MIFLNNTFIKNIEYNIENNISKDIVLYSNDYIYSGNVNENILNVDIVKNVYSVLKDISFLKKVNNKNLGFVEKKLFIFFGKFNVLVLSKNINFLNDSNYFIIYVIIDNIFDILQTLKENNIPMPNIIYSLDKYPNNIIDISNIISNYIQNIYNIHISKYVLINFCIYINMNNSILDINYNEKDKIFIGNNLMNPNENDTNIVYIINNNVKILKYKNIFKDLIKYNFYI